MFNIFSRYTPQQVKDAQQLLNLYTKESVRKFVETQLDNNRMVLWKGRPLVFYGQLFSIVAKTQQGLGEKYKKYYKDAKKSPQEFKNFLRDYVTDERKFNFFKKAVIEWEKVPQKVPVNPILPENIERLPEGQEKTKRIEGSVYQADKEIEKEEQKQDEAGKNTEGKQPEVEGQIVKGTSQPQALGQLIKTTPVKIKTLSTAVFSSLKEKLSALILKAKQVKVPSFVKNLSVNAQIAAKKFISRFPSQIAGGTAGAVAGFFVAGPAGAGLGLIGGAVAGNFINNTLLQQTPNYSSAEISEILTPQGEVINSSYATPPDNEVGEKQQGALQRKLLTRTSTLFRTGPIIIGVFIIIFLLTAFLLLFDDGGGGMFDAGSGKKPPPTGTGIQSCTFTRAGSKAQLKSSTLSGWISEAASRHQIPTAILASVVYHENPSLFPETNDHDAFKNNYYYFVNPEGETRAIGLSQISVGRTPVKDKDGKTVIVDHCKSLLASDGSFTRAADSLGKKIMDQDYYCVDDVDERVRRFCQTDTAVTGKAFYTPPDNKSDNNYLNLCQLTDNLEVGAVHLVGKLGGGSWDKQDDVTKAISGYYGKCDYGGGNYCAEVWSDYQSCQNTPTPGSGIIDTIVQWAKTITSKLDKTSTDKLLTPVTNNNGYTTGNWSGGGYACTYLVVDAYNLAGVSGLTKADHGWVVNMEKFWKNSSSLGYTYLDYQKDNQVLRQVQLGYVMFQEEKPGTITGNEHASIVQEKNIDNATGNGYIKTYDSNAGTHIEWKYTVTDWDILNNFNPHEIVTGFGGY